LSGFNPDCRSHIRSRLHVVSQSRAAQFAAAPDAANRARRFVRETLTEWGKSGDFGLESVLDDALLLTSELVTNAVRYEASPTVTVAIRCSSGELRVEVHDSSRAMPVPSDAAADAENGRGLIIIAALADEWGFYPTRHGKAVFFTLAFRGRLGVIPV
jgi:serine/threonine-protein kinase RsbW